MAALVVAVFVLVVCSSQNYPFVIWPAIIVTARGFFLPDHRQPPHAHFCANGVNPKRAQIK
jgi:hypothetical protein